jgi:hypothetical protein
MFAITISPASTSSFPDALANIFSDIVGIVKPRINDKYLFFSKYISLF